MNILNDKIVFISGSRSGIGKSTAILMAKKGTRLILHCRKKGDCKDLIEEINHIGGNAKEISCELSRVSNIPKLAKSINEVWGGLDIMINNAATILPMARASKVFKIGTLATRFQVSKKLLLCNSLTKAEANTPAGSA